MKPASRSACVWLRGSPSSTSVCCSGMTSSCISRMLRCRSKIRTVRSSGTIRPCEVYCSISRPNLPLRGILRKTSPIEMWMKLGSWPRTAPCVPLPLPGMPNRRMERYL